MFPPHLRHSLLLRPFSGHPVRLRPEPAAEPGEPDREEPDPELRAALRGRGEGAGSRGEGAGSRGEGAGSQGEGAGSQGEGAGEVPGNIASAG